MTEPVTEPRTLPVDGLTVTRIAVDDSLTLFCRGADGRTAEIRIDGAFRWQDAAGAETTGCVEDAPASAGPLLALVFARIATARIDGDGALDLGFADGARLTAAAEDHFVSWEITTGGGFHAVCLADRDVIVKDPGTGEGETGSRDLA